jgi:hypothetical protein
VIDVIRSFGFIASKTLNYLVFQSFDLERTWWRLIQKRVVRTTFDIYVFTFKLRKLAILIFVNALHLYYMYVYNYLNFNCSKYIKMHTTQIAKNCQTKKNNMKNIEMYKPLPVVKVNNTRSSDNKKNEMVALFMDSCSTTSGSCVQSRLLGPSDTYSTTSSQCEQSRLFHPISDSSSFTDSTHSQWVLPPYTPIDYRHYANAPIYKPTVSVFFIHWSMNMPSCYERESFGWTTLSKIIHNWPFWNRKANFSCSTNRREQCLNSEIRKVTDICLVIRDLVFFSYPYYYLLVLIIVRNDMDVNEYERLSNSTLKHNLN